MARHGAWLVPTLATYDALLRRWDALGWSLEQKGKRVRRISLAQCLDAAMRLQRPLPEWFDVERDLGTETVVETVHAVLSEGESSLVDLLLAGADDVCIARGSCAELLRSGAQTAQHDQVRVQLLLCGQDLGESPFEHLSVAAPSERGVAEAGHHQPPTGRHPTITRHHPRRPSRPRRRSCGARRHPVSVAEKFARRPSVARTRAPVRRSNRQSIVGAASSAPQLAGKNSSQMPMGLSKRIRRNRSCTR